MARSTRSRSSYTSVYGWVTTAATLVAGAGVSGWAMPDLPFVGPFVQQTIGPWTGGKTATPGTSSTTPPQAGASGEQRPGTTGTTATSTTGIPGTTGATSAPGPVPALGPGAVVATSAENPVSRTAPSATSTISIASYNIQVFGTTKLQQPAVRDVLVKVVRQFDVVAIQEVRSKDDSILPEFVRHINADGSRYDFVIGPRLGRTSSKEQYAFVFNTDRVEVDRSSVITLNDPQDLLHREPLVARFRALADPPEAGFTFWLVDIHTDPDEVPQEIDVLVDVFQVMTQARADEDDVILLGDLNADETQFGRLGKIPGITWVVPRSTPTNTRGNHTYDNLVFLEQATAEFTGRWGVVNMCKAFNLSVEEALKVSDHLPVWAEFRSREAAPPNTALRSGALPR